MQVNRRILIIPLGIAAFLFLVFVPIVPLTIGPFEKCTSGLCIAVPPDAKMLPNGEYVYREIVSINYYLSGSCGVINGQRTKIPTTTANEKLRRVPINMYSLFSWSAGYLKIDFAAISKPTAL